MKNLLIMILSLFLFANAGFAFALDDEFGIEKAMFIRNDIQNKLDLSAQQQVFRTEINAKYHPLFDKKFAQIGEKINRLRILSGSDNCTKEQVDSIVAEFKIDEDELFNINKDYEKEFKKMLTPTQRVKYSVLKYKSKRQLKKELDVQIKNIRSEK